MVATKTAPEVGLHGRWLSLTAFMPALAILLYVVAPMSGAILVPVAGLVVVATYFSREGHLPVPRCSKLLWTFLIGGVYLAINSTWSFARPSAYHTVVLYFSLVGISAAAIAIVQQSSCEAIRSVAAGIVVGVACGALFLACELLYGQPLRRLLMSYILVARPSNPSQLRVDEASVIYLLPELLNKGAAALSFCLWPAFLIASRLDARGWQRVLLYAGLGIGVLAIFGSAHETSKIAFLGAAAMYTLVTISPAAALRVSILGWTVSTLLAVPLCLLAYQHKLHFTGNLPETLQARIVIWGYTSEQVLRAPVLGVGVQSSATLSRQDHSRIGHGSGTVRVPPRHSHSIYVQVWFEAGIIGAAVLFFLGLFVLRWAATQGRDVQPYLYATFTACALIGAASYNAWAAWFMASFALASMLSSVGIALGPRVASTARDRFPKGALRPM